MLLFSAFLVQVAHPSVLCQHTPSIVIVGSGRIHLQATCVGAAVEPEGSHTVACIH